MEQFAYSFIETVLHDFKKAVQSLPELCALRELNYNNEYVPDYSHPIIQQYYLLRYFLAYSAEYCQLYSDVHNHFSPRGLNILSVGCGCGVDYFGLHLALANREPLELNYIGVDKVNWMYREQLTDQRAHFITKDVREFRSLPFPNCNLIMFGKSLSELGDTSLAALLDAIRNTVFIRKNIFLAASMSRKGEEESFNRVTSAFIRDLGYKLPDAGIISGRGDDRKLLDKGINYFLPALKQNCKHYGYYSKCNNCSIDRAAMMSRAYFWYKIVPLVRE